MLSIARDLLTRHRKLSKACSNLPEDADSACPVDSALDQQGHLPYHERQSVDASGLLDDDALPSEAKQGTRPDVTGSPDNSQGATADPNIPVTLPQQQVQSTAAPATMVNEDLDPVSTIQLSDTVGQDVALPDATVDPGQYDLFWHDFFPMGHPLPAEFINTDFSLVNISEQYASNACYTFNESQYGTGNPVLSDANPFAIRLDHAQASVEHVGQVPGRLTSRLPSLEEAAQSTDDAPAPAKTNVPLSGRSPCGPPWRVMPDAYRQLEAELDDIRHVIPSEYMLPTRHTLTRYLEGYFRGFHAHLPFLHVPTLAVERLGLGLVLAYRYGCTLPF